MQDAPLPWRLRDETLPGSDGSGAVCRSVSSKSKQAVKPCLLISPDLLEVFLHFFLKLLLANHRVFCSSVGSLFAVKRNYCDLICLF